MNKNLYKKFFAGAVNIFALSLFVVLGVITFNANAYAATPIIQSAKITGPNNVTIYFSEPVITKISDYTTFSGSLAGRNLTAISGSGTASISLTFDGNAFPGNASGSLNIGTQTISISDSSPFTTGYVNVLDGQPPVVSSITISSNGVNNSFASAGSYITVSWSANEPLTNSMLKIAGNTVSTGGSGTGPYSANYTITGNEPTPLPISGTFSDYVGNTGSFAMTLDNTKTTSSGTYNLTSTANTPGGLKIGDKIIFTLTPNTPKPGASVSGSYNEQPLTWTTSNSGTTFTAIYTVQSGDPDRASPLQINGVIITDSNGFASAPISGNDVKKTIVASLPMVAETVPVPSMVTTATPSYSFTSSKAGSINYYGDCSSQTKNAVPGLNTIVFNPLPNGYHSNCYVSVTDSAGNISNRGTVNSFTVSANGNTTTGYTPDTPNQTSTATSYRFSNPLNIGSTGTDVRELQKRLTNEGYYSGPITGYYGSLTQIAVKKYQAAHGLEQLGNVGPGTRSALNK